MVNMCTKCFIGNGILTPGFLDNRHIKVVRLSALRTGRLYPLECPGTHFERLSRPQASEKIPSDMTGDRSGDLPTSSAAP
jgi:hypothetical protein